MSGSAFAVYRLRRGLALVAAALALSTASAAAAGGSSIVYVCGANLCQIGPDGSGQKQLTTDGRPGTSAIYTGPSLSRNGKKLSFVFQGHVVVSTVGGSTGAPFATTSAVETLMRPDGKRLAELETTSNNPGVQLCTYALDGSARNCPYGVPSAAWAPDGSLLISVQAEGQPYNRVICRVPVAANAPCSDIRASDPAHDLYDPAVSPDGRTLAVTVTSGIGAATTGHIALYDYASGKLLGNLTSGSSDETPVWSPDGSQIAFARAGGIYVIAANGAGGEHRLATGSEPTWGGTTTGGSGGSTSATGALKLAIGAPSQSVVGGRALVERVACSLRCAVGAVGEVAISGGKTFKTASVVKVLAAGVVTDLKLALSPAAIAAVRSALAAHRKVVAELGAVAQVGAQKKQAAGSFVVTR